MNKIDKKFIAKWLEILIIEARLATKVKVKVTVNEKGELRYKVNAFNTWRAPKDKVGIALDILYGKTESQFESIIVNKYFDDLRKTINSIETSGDKLNFDGSYECECGEVYAKGMHRFYCRQKHKSI